MQLGTARPSPSNIFGTIGLEVLFKMCEAPSSGTKAFKQPYLRADLITPWCVMGLPGNYWFPQHPEQATVYAALQPHTSAQC